MLCCAALFALGCAMGQGRAVHHGCCAHTPLAQHSQQLAPGPSLPLCPQELLKNWEELPPMLATSSRAGSGRGELLAHISQLREAFKRAGRV